MLRNNSSHEKMLPRLTRKLMQHTQAQPTALTRRGGFALRLRFAARAVVACALLLILVGGNLLLTATAKSELCVLACCASRAPHAAGSCMQDSCETGMDSSHHGHNHESNSDDTTGDTPSGFAGVTAGAHGTDMDEVPTVEATASNGAASPASKQSNSVATLSTPCQPDCGVSNSLFQTTKRPKNFSTVTSAQRKPEQHLVGVAANRSVRVSISSGFARQAKPRGPPALVKP